MIKVEKTEKTEKINHYKQIVKSLYLTNITKQNNKLKKTSIKFGKKTD